MKAATIVSTLALAIVAGGVRADIVEWEDEEGTRHFTNVREVIPSQASPRVVVPEVAKGEERLEAPAAPRATEPVRQAQVVYDRSHLEAAYLEGVRHGMEIAESDSPTSATRLSFSAPLAVANALAHGAGVDYPLYPYGLVTTSFDRGRSRHLTLRMLLQDQFQLDRDGPFVRERFPSGQGVNLHPFLPRGLPRGYPRGARVLF
jgi:hypothetical protein